jgi:hypothetical protein
MNHTQGTRDEMIVKKAISFFSELSETTLSNGMNSCKSAINRISKLMSWKSGEGKFEGLLKSALKPHELLKKENMIKFKEKLFSKNGMDDSNSICCPQCGLVLPPYCIFCLDCGTQLFEDILRSDSNKSTTNFFKPITHLLDCSFFLDNVRLLLFLLKKLDKCVFPLNRLDYRI